jgi:hypothetical protein
MEVKMSTSETSTQYKRIKEIIKGAKKPRPKIKPKKIRDVQNLKNNKKVEI